MIIMQNVTSCEKSNTIPLSLLSQIQQLCKMFVGGLSQDTDVETLKERFKKYGEITDAVVIKDADTKRSRGFGFITFDSPEAVDACLAGRPHEIDGREVEVKQAIPRGDSNPSAHIRSVASEWRGGEVVNPTAHTRSVASEGRGGEGRWSIPRLTQGLLPQREGEGRGGEGRWSIPWHTQGLLPQREGEGRGGEVVNPTAHTRSVASEGRGGEVANPTAYTRSVASEGRGGEGRWPIPRHTQGLLPQRGGEGRGGGQSHGTHKVCCLRGEGREGRWPIPRHTQGLLLDDTLYICKSSKTEEEYERVKKL